MIILRKYPNDIHNIKFLGFISCESLIKLNEQITLHYMFDSTEKARDSLIAKSLYNSKKEALINTLISKANEIKANAICEFTFQIEKLDAKHILLIANGFAVNIPDLPEVETFHTPAPNVTTTESVTYTNTTGDEVSNKYSDDVKRMFENDEISKIDGTYPDLGGSHQMNMLGAIKTPIDSEPLDLETQKAPSLTGIESITPIERAPIIDPVQKEFSNAPTIEDQGQNSTRINQSLENATRSITPKIEVEANSAQLQTIKSLMKDKE